MESIPHAIDSISLSFLAPSARLLAAFCSLRWGVMMDAPVASDPVAARGAKASSLHRSSLCVMAEVTRLHASSLCAASQATVCHRSRFAGLIQLLGSSFVLRGTYASLFSGGELTAVPAGGGVVGLLTFGRGVC